MPRPTKSVGALSTAKTAPARAALTLMRSSRMLSAERRGSFATMSRTTISADWGFKALPPRGGIPSAAICGVNRPESIPSFRWLRPTKKRPRKGQLMYPSACRGTEPEAARPGLGEVPVVEGPSRCPGSTRFRLMLESLLVRLFVGPYPLVQPVENGVVPEDTVGRLQDPVVLLPEIQELSLHVHDLEHLEHRLALAGIDAIVLDAVY